MYAQRQRQLQLLQQFQRGSTPSGAPANSQTTPEPSNENGGDGGHASPSPSRGFRNRFPSRDASPSGEGASSTQVGTIQPHPPAADVTSLASSRRNDETVPPSLTLSLGHASATQGPGQQEPSPIAANPAGIMGVKGPGISGISEGNQSRGNPGEAQTPSGSSQGLTPVNGAGLSPANGNTPRTSLDKGAGDSAGSSDQSWVPLAPGLEPSTPAGQTAAPCKTSPPQVQPVQPGMAVQGSAVTASDAQQRSSKNPVVRVAEAMVAQLLVSPSDRKRQKTILLREDEIRIILTVVRDVFMSQPMLLEVQAPVKICGDVHGQYYDLLRIFDKCGYPPDSSFLFLGDYRENFILCQF